MKTKYLDAYCILSDRYSKPSKGDNSLKNETLYKGSDYKLMGVYEKKYSSGNCFLKGIIAFVKTFFSFGFALISKKLQEDWNVVVKKKLPVVVYKMDFPEIKGEKKDETETKIKVEKSPGPEKKADEKIGNIDKLSSKIFGEEGPDQEQLMPIKMQA